MSGIGQQLVDHRVLALTSEVLLKALEVKPAILPGRLPLWRALQITDNPCLL